MEGQCTTDLSPSQLSFVFFDPRIVKPNTDETTFRGERSHHPLPSISSGHKIHSSLVSNRIRFSVNRDKLTDFSCQHLRPMVRLSFTFSPTDSIVPGKNWLFWTKTDAAPIEQSLKSSVFVTLRAYTYEGDKVVAWWQRMRLLMYLYSVHKYKITRYHFIFKPTVKDFERC